MDLSDLIKISNISNAVLRKPFSSPIKGSLCISGHHLLFLDDDGAERLLLLHSLIDVLERKSEALIIVLKCKDFQYFRIDLKDAEEFVKLANTIENLSNIGSVQHHYAFLYCPSYSILEDGWKMFSASSTFANLPSDAQKLWRISHVNADFKVCASYPSTVIVPAKMTDATLLCSAKFRRHGRFPVLSYYHAEKQTFLMRSSEPLVGPKGRRSREDEQMLTSVLPSGKKAFIIDTRNEQKVKVAQAKGGGTEPGHLYGVWKVVHRAMFSVYALQTSASRFLQACEEIEAGTDRWLNRLEASAWLCHIQRVLKVASLLVRCLHCEDSCVLVHGTDGSDATLVLCSVVQLLLHPESRTLNGITAIVQHEWIEGGHPFGTRCRKGFFYAAEGQKNSPVFLLWLDCVWQLLQQYPASFEFNQLFLETLFQNAYSSSFGTFLCDNEKERLEEGIDRHTVSFWSHTNVSHIRSTFLNPLYKRRPHVIWPNVASQCLSLWTDLYMKHSLGPQLNRGPDMCGEVKNFLEEERNAEDEVAELQRALQILESEMSQHNLFSSDVVDFSLDPKNGDIYEHSISNENNISEKFRDIEIDSLSVSISKDEEPHVEESRCKKISFTEEGAVSFNTEDL